MLVRIRLASLALTLVVASFLTPRIAAAADEGKLIFVPVSSSKHLRLGQAVTRVSVGATDVADVAAFPPDEILVTGRRIGSTSVTVWFRNAEVAVYTIRVEYPVGAMTDALTKSLPDAKDLKVIAAGNSLVINGEVSNVNDVGHAEDIVRGFAVGENPPTVVNRLQVPGDNQVQIEVSFAEVSRSALKQIGINMWHKGKDPSEYTGGLTAPGTSSTGLVPDLAATAENDTLSMTGGLPIIQAPLSGTFGAVFATSATGSFPFTAALSVLSERGYSRTLAEPTLVALSGQTASFLAGGEFPVPLPQALGQVGVEFKKFGIHLAFIPTVVGSNIQLRLNASVSDIDFSLGLRLAGVTVPGLTERTSETTIRLKDGESFAVAGLLSDRVRSTVDKFPGLGDLPVLGMLFRSTSYRREETELLVVVTARLVHPQGERPHLPGEDTLSDPGDLELFFLGSIESKDGRDDKLHPHGRSKPQGPVGFAR